MTLGGIVEIQIEEGVVKTKHCRSLVTVKAVSDKDGIHTLTRDLRQAGRLHPLIFLSSQAMLRTIGYAPLESYQNDYIPAEILQKPSQSDA